jgi:hypothetical protein
MLEGIRERITGRTLRLAGLAAGAPLLLSACNQVGTNSLTFWDIVWSMIVFFFLFMFLMIWFQAIIDLFRRDDLSGGWKAIWILVLIFIPLIGVLVYMITRPKVTAQDIQMMARADAAAGAAGQVSVADEIAKLDQLRSSGAINGEEYDRLKAKLVGGAGS